MMNRVSAGALSLCLGAALLAACEGGDRKGGTTGGAGATTTGAAGATTTGAAGGSTTGAAGTGTTGAAGTGTTGAAGASTTGAAGVGAAGTGAAGANTTGAAGTGAAGAGAAGTGAAGTGSSGGVKSDGCSKPAGQALMTYVKYNVMVPNVAANAQMRSYFAWLPANYDPNRAYPTIVVGPGCGGSGDNTIKPQTASGDKAIIVGLNISAMATGRDCFMTESATSFEINYFDETLKDVESKFCVDKSRVFMEGFSSGSWLTNLIGCARGDVLKGQGNSSGCTPPIPNPCKGPIAMMGVTNDPDPNNSYTCGTSNRDRIAKLNGCSTQTMPYDPGPMVHAASGGVLECTQFVGCMPGKPVVWCRTTNLGHNDGSVTGISTYGFWDFWSKLP